VSDILFKPFEDMTPEDYAAVGFRSGLEIHQQILTEKKLFCRCPAGCYSPVYEAEILRHMRPTLSELGEYDGTALMEFKTKKEIIYRIHHDTVCTYEMDDTPPFELNEEALDIALEVAMLYGCSMIDELHIARKQYLDGSIPTGFQRTTIVGVDGRIPYRDREIRIVQLGLEEDACREVSDIGHRRIYLTDRLGMPLIETVTAPDMHTPHEVAEVGQILRRLVRSTGKVRTGIGAGRQDVNVSVTGGTRIEIKGVPRIPRIPRLTYNEAMRQWNLLRLRTELAKKGITPETFAFGIEDVTRVLRRTAYLPIQTALSSGLIVLAVRLQGFSGLLRWATQTNTVFAQEISDRVRVIACLTALPNIMHSDSPGEGLMSSEWQAVRKTLGAGQGDAVVLVWGGPEDARLGAREIAERAREATVGIPSETRQALEDETNGFERILPGPDRMYPDTDLPPKRVLRERRERIRAGLPPNILDREARYAAAGVPVDLRAPLASSSRADLFETAVAEWGVEPELAAVVLVQYPKRLKRKGLPADGIEDEILRDLLAAVGKGRLAREGILPVLEKAVETGTKAEDLLPEPAGEKEIETALAEALTQLESMTFKDPGAGERFAMGRLMERFRGRAAGRGIAENLRKRMGEARA
jgi:glutamyl-tRNA(Gln) amidotransferase subunit E